MKKRAHLHISGRVQGVLFRDSTRRKARKNNISGWVRNLEDGRVEAVFEGEKEDVERMIEWAKKGPLMAKVDNIKVEWEDPRRSEEDFEVIY